MRPLSSLAFGVAATCLPACVLFTGYPRSSVDLEYLPDLQRPTVHGMVERKLRFAFVPEPSSPLIEVDLRIHAGASHHDGARSGLAHLVEHLAYRLDGPSAEPLTHAFADISLRYNAHTTADYTHFQTTALPHRLGEILRLYRTILSGDCSSIDDDEFLAERNIVLSELRERADKHRLPPWEHMLGFIFPPDHPYAHGVGGSVQSVGRLQREDVCAFIQAHYVPRNAQIMITGQVDRAAVVAAVSTELTHLLDAPPTDDRHFHQFDTISAMDTQTSKVCPGVTLAFPLPEPGHRDHLPAQLWIDILSETLRQYEGQGTLEVPSATILELRYGWTLLVSATADGRVGSEEITQRLWRAIDDANSARMDALSFDHLRRNFMADSVARWEQFDRRTAIIAEGVVPDTDDIIRWFSMTRLDSVAAVGARHFTPDKAKHLGFTANCGDSSAPRESRIHGSFSPEVDLSWNVGEERIDTILAGLEHWLATIWTYDLANGLKVVMAPRRGLHTFRARLMIRSGRADSPVDAPLLADATALLARPDSDVPTEQSSRLEEFVRAGGDIDVDVQHRLTSFSVTGLAVYADHMLSGLSATMMATDYDRKALRALESPATLAALPELAATDRLATMELADSLLGPLSCMTPPAGVRPGAYTPRTLRAHRRANYQAASSVLLLVGDFDVPLLVDHVGAFFGSRSQLSRLTAWESAPRSSVAAAAFADTLRFERRVERIPMRTRQLHVETVFVLPQVFRTSQAHRLVLEAMTNAELRQLREHVPGTYGFGAQVVELCGLPMLHISGSANRPQAAAVLHELDRAIVRLRGDELDVFLPGFARARLSAAVALLNSSQDGKRLVEYIEDVLRHGGDLKSFLALGVSLRDLNPEHFREILLASVADERMLRKCRGPDRSIAHCK